MATTLKDKVKQEGVKLLGHPRLQTLMQDERFMKLVMAALSVPGKLSSLSEEQRANLVKALGLATADEVRDLKRVVRALESELAEVRAELTAMREGEK
ncbi:MAG: hypothetical protein IT373_03685 [Polyangiaceae bacterium]|nr:hypothetical protein [Polyangiaceae bacterium]